MTPAQARAMYRRQIDASGEDIILRRKGVADVTVRAKATDAGASDIVGSAQQASRMFIVLAEDVERAGFSPPFQARLDSVVYAGRVLAITRADDTKRRVAGVVIAYELHCAGQ
jgi:hypothetical protein